MGLFESERSERVKGGGFGKIEEPFGHFDEADKIGPTRPTGSARARLIDSTIQPYRTLTYSRTDFNAQWQNFRGKSRPVYGRRTDFPTKKLATAVTTSATICKV